VVVLGLDVDQDVGRLERDVSVVDEPQEPAAEIDRILAEPAQVVRSALGGGLERKLVGVIEFEVVELVEIIEFEKRIARHGAISQISHGAYGTIWQYSVPGNFILPLSYCRR